MPIVSIIMTLPSIVKPEAVCKSLNPIDVPTPPYAEMISHATVKILTWRRLKECGSDSSETFGFHWRFQGRGSNNSDTRWSYLLVLEVHQAMCICTHENGGVTSSGYRTSISFSEKHSVTKATAIHPIWLNR